MSLTNALMLIAVFMGPVSAVLITRWLDDRRDRAARRMDLFRTLMRTRRTPMSAEHVGALNLVEIEFAKDTEVLRWWQKLFEHFGAQHARRDHEIVFDSHSEEDRRARDAAFEERIIEERQRLLARLLHAMAVALRFKIEQLEIFEGGYSPQGWAFVENEQTLVRRYFIELAAGRRCVPVAIVNYPQSENVADPLENSSAEKVQHESA